MLQLGFDPNSEPKLEQPNAIGVYVELKICETKVQIVQADNKDKRIGKATDNLLESLPYFQKHVKACHGDLTLLVLKAHLLIEKQLDGIILDQLGLDSFPKELKLEFDQKLHLARAVVCSHKTQTNADNFISIKSLNELRNKLAHRLEDEELLLERVTALLKLHCKHTNFSFASNEKIELQLTKALQTMWGFLVKTRYALHVQDEQ